MKRNDGRADLSGKVVVITGASGGVGRAAVRAFAARGAKLALLARGADGLEAAREEAGVLGGEAIALRMDVADAEQMHAAAGEAEERLGPIDIWVNNAMTTIFAPLHAITPAEFRRATEVTYLGTVWGTMAALARMRRRNRGVIVQVGSALAYRAIPLQSPYCGAKHAVRGFTDAVRSELIHDGSEIHLTMVQLPALNTPQFDWCETRLPNQPQPVPPIFQPEVAAEAIVFAATHRRREIAVGLPTVKTIWGQKFLPGFLDRYLAGVAWDGQMTDEPIDPERPSNLWAPVAGDHGAHGRFDARAREAAPQLWANMHRGWLFAGAGALAGAA
ncbi:MAG: SDR family oxidoreductase, partial [Longimicrobiales bacterium]